MPTDKWVRGPTSKVKLIIRIPVYRLSLVNWRRFRPILIQALWVTQDCTWYSWILMYSESASGLRSKDHKSYTVIQHLQLEFNSPSILSELNHKINKNTSILCFTNKGIYRRGVAAWVSTVDSSNDAKRRYLRCMDIRQPGKDRTKLS